MWTRWAHALRRQLGIAERVGLCAGGALWWGHLSIAELASEKVNPDPAGSPDVDIVRKPLLWACPPTSTNKNMHLNKKLEHN